MKQLLELIKGCALQDRKCQEELYLRYHGLCLKCAFRYVNTYEQAAKVTHEGFLQVFLNFRQFEIRKRAPLETSLIRWIKNIIIQKAIDSMRPELSNTPYPSPNDPGWEQAAEKVLPPLSSLYYELIILLKKLPAVYRTVYNLYVIDGYPCDEILEMLGITATSSAWRLNKARLTLLSSLPGANGQQTATGAVLSFWPNNIDK